MKLNEEQLSEYEQILNMETLDIFNLITGNKDRTADNKEIPEHVKGEILDSLQAYAISSPAGEADPAAYAEIKSKMSN
jgi:succinate dehydrogenase flavin-adding protein (antitoxin of CptAB toxin-antitoxin module)